MKAIYTEAAKSEIEAFRIRQQEMLEELVSERKSVFGDDILEITASDVKSAGDRIRVYRPNIARSRLNDLVTRSYFFIGVLMMIGAYFYPTLLELYSSNRTQALIFSMGAAIASMGALFGAVNTYRRRRMSEANEYFRLLERRKVQEIEKIVDEVNASVKTIDQ